VTEELSLYVAMLLAALPTVVATVASGRRFGGGASLCLALIALGLVGIAGRVRAARRLPRANLRR